VGGVDWQQALSTSKPKTDQVGDPDLGDHQRRHLSHKHDDALINDEQDGADHGREANGATQDRPAE
jgi:hypothetical protein